MDKYSNLSSLIKILSENRSLHICINDLTGILQKNLLKLDKSNKMHSIPFCDIAKSTTAGYKLCIRCKTLANKRAVYKRIDFSGFCPYGLFEYVKPVIFKKSVACIIYIGNIIIDKNKSKSKLIKTANLTGVDVTALEAELINAELAKTTEEYIEIANIIDSYIRLLIQSKTDEIPQSNHAESKWRINEIIDYINENYYNNISVKQFADLYFMNEKYLGRYFRKETGVSIKQYLNTVRLERAKVLLKETDKTILEISLDCGFQNVTYFNRKFVEATGLSPTKFRLTQQVKD